MISQSPPGAKSVPEAMHVLPVGADRRGLGAAASVAEAASVNSVVSSSSGTGASGPGASLLPGIGIGTPKGTSVLKGKLDEAELMRRRRAEAVLGMGEIAEAA